MSGTDHIRQSPKRDGQRRTEVAVLGVMGAVIAVALFAGYTEVRSPLLDRWLLEDGVVEWLTVIGLLSCAAVCLYRVFTLRGYRPFVFLMGSLLAAVAFLFGAGEEISWGQRLFGIATPAWFAENNLQAELNVHNLVIGSRDLNKLLFGKLLTLGIAVFLLFPVVYRRSGWFRRLVDRFGVPVARPRHAVMLLLSVLLLQVVELRGRASELFEFATVFLVLLILLNPLNRSVFERTGQR